MTSRSTAKARPAHAPTQLHVAIIMDGNGRWANARGWPRLAGHHEGARAVRRVVEASPDHGIGTLSLYAFSADNWQRPPAEVGGLMRLLRETIRSEVAECQSKGVRISFAGRRDRLAAPVIRAMEEAERATREGARLHLRIAVDYSGREAIARAVARLADLGGGGSGLSGDPRRDADEIEHALGQIETGPVSPPVDLLIRTAGEQRLSDFMLWECAYAELYFTEKLWPEFGAHELGEAVRAFHARERRFGGLLPKRAAS